MGTGWWRWVSGLALLVACTRVQVEPAEGESVRLPSGVPTTNGSSRSDAAPSSPLATTRSGSREAVTDGGVPEVGAILTAARSGKAYERLVSLCDDVGHRLSGSANYQRAVLWGVARFEEDGVPRVATEPVEVPAWVRGQESVQMVRPRALMLPMLGLGGSPGTPGIEADVVVVPDVESVDDSVRGRIVLFHSVMETRVPAYEGYGGAVAARTKGPAAAARHGAVGALVRSITTRSLASPHTGVTVFEEGEPQIPAAAVATEHADMMARMIARGQTVRVRMEMEAHWKPDQNTHNVVAEIPGRERPEEVVLIGGHLDSWDVGQGAHDDGAGIAEVIESMRILAAMPPARRTIRAVLFANEENGLRGGRAYFAAHEEEVHVAAIETDLGGGWPLGWGATGTDEQLEWLAARAAPLGLPVRFPGGGADISPLKANGTLTIGLRPDDRHYFDVHHTHADTVDKVEPASLREATGALAALAWLLANAESAPLPTGKPLKPPSESGRR